MLLVHSNWSPFFPNTVLFLMMSSWKNLSVWCSNEALIPICLIWSVRLPWPQYHAPFQLGHLSQSVSVTPRFLVLTALCWRLGPDEIYSQAAPLFSCCSECLIALLLSSYGGSRRLHGICSDGSASTDVNQRLGVVCVRGSLAAPWFSRFNTRKKLPKPLYFVFQSVKNEWFV